MTFKKLSSDTENIIERLIFASRWLLAPLFLGLAASLFILLLKFMEGLFHIASNAIHATESEVILGVLSLVDIVLTGSLLVIVIFSGYENFVSKIDHSGHEDWPAWMGTIDFTALKAETAVVDRRHLRDPAPEAVHGDQDRERSRADVVRDDSPRIRDFERAAGAVGPHRRWPFLTGEWRRTLGPGARHSGYPASDADAAHDASGLGRTGRPRQSGQ